MRSYYYSDGQETFGPFSLEELVQTQLTPESLIWFEGLEEWIQAGTLPELAELFSQQQTIPATDQLPTTQQSLYADSMHGSPAVKKKSYKLLFLFSGIFLLLVAGLVMLVVTGVVKLPLLPGAKIEIVSGDPEKDFLKMIEKQQAFSRLAFEAARDGVISKKEIDGLANVYADILKIMAAYSQDENKKYLFDALHEGSHGAKAIEVEENYSESIALLSTCSGFDDFLDRMEQVLNLSGLSISDF